VKSEILIEPSSVIKIFSGFKSRCSSLFLCRWFKAVTLSLIIF